MKHKSNNSSYNKLIHYYAVVDFNWKIIAEIGLYRIIIAFQNSVSRSMI